MGKIDFDKIAASYPVSAIVGKRVRLTAAGRGEFKGLCPFHQERTPSFTVSDAKGFWHCYGCGEHGDVVDFIAQTEGVSITEAVRILTGDDYKPTQRDEAAPPAHDPLAGITPAEIPDGHEPFQVGQEIEVWNPRKERIWRMRPSMVFPYTDTAGGLIGYVVRVEFDDGKKVTPTLRFVQLPDGTRTWASVPFPKPRPLYWAARAEGQALIVEGEKAADAAARMLPIAVCTWPGGTQGVKHADWSGLAGRKCIVWPDADEPGIEAAEDIAARLLAMGCEVKIAQPDDDMPKGYDAADAERDGWDKARAVAWLRAATARRKPEAPEPQAVPPPEEPPHDAEPPAPPPLPATKISDGWPFRVLGFNEGEYYYLPHSTHQITALTASSHTIKNLLQLAPLEFWENHFSGHGKAAELAATNSLIALAHAEGAFWPDKLKGRGAWKDEGQTVPVYHLGNDALVGRDIVRLQQINDGNIYPSRKPMPKPDLSIAPASSAECKRLVNLLERLSWENPLSAVALAGWIVLAPVCGAVNWRPHLWLTGGAGSGKTTVMLDIIWRLLKGFAHKFEGATTEAGIRQTIGIDTLPVLFDEAEAESDKAQARMTSILDLARLASSGSSMSKGSQDGEAKQYQVRSMFLFSSIEHSIKQHADHTRITKVVLKKRADETANEDFKQLRKDILEWLTPEFATGLFLRTWYNLDTLLANITTCVDAAAHELKDRRAADQIGTLIAGYIHLHTTNRITFDQALEFVRRYDWTDHAALGSRTAGENVLERILTHQMTVSDGSGTKRVTIAEMALAARSDGGVMGRDDARRQLAPLGLKACESGLMIANSASRLGKEVLAGTQWEADWARALQELDGAEKGKETAYFAGKIRARFTLVPWDLIETPGDDALHAGEELV